MGHNIVVPEEEQVDIEYSIEERIEENLSKLDLEPKSPVRPRVLQPSFQKAQSLYQPDLLKVNTVISDQNNGFVELNMAQDSDTE